MRPVVIGAVLTALGMSAANAQQACPAANGGVPPGANTSNPSAPFYIDTSGLSFVTSPPTRDPHNPNYVPATELPDGTIPLPTQNGNFIIGPTHTAAPETVAQAGVPKGTILSYTMTSANSVIYRPGAVRDDPNGCLDASVYTAPTVPGDPSHIIITTSHAGTWTRSVNVYMPAFYVPGPETPFMVTGDAGITGPTGSQLFTVLDNLIFQRRLPPMVVISIGPGGQDAQGSERGREYDTVSGDYAQWVESEVLPALEGATGLHLTRNPDGRATIGISSSGAAAFAMAYFHPELYRRVLAYSPTLVNQQWPHQPWLPGGAWEFHSPWAGPALPNEEVQGFASPTPSTLPTGVPLLVQSARKPIRFW
ncbi:MAG: esterase family protein, partial [Acetobacteraceae bacterium]|nr:esterase family protein [Acetobacteraceae bacterium]